MDVKLKTFDIRKPQVSIGTKPFLTVRERVGVSSGNLTFVLHGNTNYIVGNLQEEGEQT